MNSLVWLIRQLVHVGEMDRFSNLLNAKFLGFYYLGENVEPLKVF